MQNNNQNGPERSLPSTEQELEEYGVWVKAEPQDIVEETESEHAFLDSEFEEPESGKAAADTLAGDDALLSFEEESTLDSYTSGNFEQNAETDIQFLDDTPVADDFGSDDELVIEELEDVPEMAKHQGGSAAAQAEDGDDVIDIPLDDLDYDAPVAQKTAEIAEETRRSSSSASDDLEMTELSLDDFGLDDSSETVPSEKPAQQSASSKQAATEELDVDAFLASDGPAEGFEAVSFEDESAAPIAADDDAQDQEAVEDQDEFLEPIDLDLQFDDTIPSVEDAAGVDEIDFNPDEVTDISDAGGGKDEFDADALLADVFDEAEPQPQARPAAPSLEEEEISLDFSAPEKPGFGMAGMYPEDAPAEPASSFDDVQAFEADMSDSTQPDIPPAKPAPAAEVRAQADTSSQLLLQIASELSSIKSELMNLRSQLNEIKETRPESGLSESAAATGAGAEEEIAESSKGGFFDEEDDETIALTGDELDNILNTADFTEETLLEESVGEEPDLGGFELPVPDLSAEPVETQEAAAETTLIEESGDLLPEDGMYQNQSSGIEVIDADTSAESVDSPESAAEPEVLVEEFPSEITPQTPAPEDTSYLEAELEAYPLDDVPLEEPDLSELSLEEVLVEEAQDSNEELPVLDELEASAEALPDPDSMDSIEELELGEDGLELESAPEYEEEIELDIDATLEGEETVLDLPSDSIPELEDEPFDIDFDSDASEIELHAESAGTPEPVAEGAKPVEPVVVHPDELSLSLDDSFFVEPEPEAIREPGTAANGIEDDLVTEVYEETVEEEPVPALQAEPEVAQPEEKVVPELGIPAKPVVPDKLSHDIKSVLLYLDQLLSALPEEKIEEFASSEYYDTYKKLFEELGIL